MLSQLCQQLQEAREADIAESVLQEALNEVRSKHPKVEESWDEILDRIEVEVWLEDGDGNRITTTIEEVDWILWSNGDEEELLEPCIEELRYVFDANWKVLSSGDSR